MIAVESMKVITTRKEIQMISSKLKKEGKTIGFVPTMGFLHEGHLTLVEKARQENDVVLMSIFVNPLQFGPNEDFDRYPRDEEGDRQKAQKAGVDYLFIPSVNEMYPHPLSIKMTVQERTNVLCGKKRPGHFDGVTTVLTKLFHLIQPNRAYFGLKDAQQVAVVEGLVHDLDFPIDIIPVEIVREADGLARSSRNVYLSDDERREAPQLYKSLQIANTAIVQGERYPSNVISLVKNYLEMHTSGAVDYVELYSYPELHSLEQLSGRFILAIAVQFEKARLIDNIIISL